MIGAQKCDGESTEYHLCKKSSTLLSKDNSCYFKKIGKLVNAEILYPFILVYLNRLLSIFNCIVSKCVIELHCFDGLKSGDEDGVDCGGSSCDPCKGIRFHTHNRSCLL